MAGSEMVKERRIADLGTGPVANSAKSFGAKALTF